MKKYFNDIVYTFLANIITLLTTASITFILPKIMGVIDYGYVQLYLFYANYTGFLHLGWADGIYLKYGGKYYENIDKKVFSGQFWLYSLVEFSFAFVILISGFSNGFTEEKTIVFIFTGIAVAVYLPRTLLQYVLQSTSRIKEYSAIIIIDRLIYFFIILFIIFKKLLDLYMILSADILAKTISLIMALFYCKDIIFTSTDKLYNVIKEAKDNIHIGIKLMFSNIASMLIIGIIRLAIENKWDIGTFGKISLTMSISSMLMTLINAVAMIMFPALRRSKEEQLLDIYMRIRPFVVIPMLGMLLFYYPMKTFLSFWLPEYADSLQYMAILFPMCLFECKMSLLISTYMKTLRKEKWLMQVNIITLFISFVLTILNVYVLQSLALTVFSVVILLGFRSVIAELLLSRFFNISLYKINIEEVGLSIIFIFSSWFIRDYRGMLIYLSFYILYLFNHKKTLKFMVTEIRQQVRI